MSNGVESGSRQMSPMINLLQEDPSLVRRHCETRKVDISVRLQFGFHKVCTEHTAIFCRSMYAALYPALDKTGFRLRNDLPQNFIEC